MPLFDPNMIPISRPVHHPVPFLAKLAQPTPRVGLQLTVSGLEHGHPQAAVSHIERLVHYHNQEHPANTLPSLAFTLPESRTPVDYVYVALSPPGAAQPRADLLERARSILSGFNGVRAYWKVSNGLTYPEGFISRQGMRQTLTLSNPSLTSISALTTSRRRVLTLTRVSTASLMTSSPTSRSPGYSRTPLYLANIPSLQNGTASLNPCMSSRSRSLGSRRSTMLQTFSTATSVLNMAMSWPVSG